MRKTKINKITKYLNHLPDSTESQIVTFLGYLNYINRIDIDMPYQDEIEAFKKYEKDTKTYSWDKVKNKL